MNNEAAAVLEDDRASALHEDNFIEDTEDLNSVVESILSGVLSSPVYIDDLPDAVVDGKLILKEGDLIVIEKWLTIAQTPKWLGTSLYRIRRIDPLNDNGDLGLHDEELSQGAQANWKNGPKHGWRFKCAVPGLNLHKRAKPEFEDKHTKALEKVKNLAAEIGPLPTSMLATGTEGLKKGGRPKGVKNRSLAERLAAQKAEAEKRAAKAARREARKAGRK